MGNKNFRRPQKVPLAMSTTSPVSSKSSGISPKTITKSTNKAIAAANMIIDGEVKISIKEGTGLEEAKDGPKQLLGLPFKSMRNKSLGENHCFQGAEDLKMLKKKEMEKNAVATSKPLSATASHFVPSAVHGKHHQPAAAGSSQSKKSSTRKQSQSRASRPTRHNKRRPKPSPCPAKIDGHIPEMQPFPPFTPNTHAMHPSNDSTDSQPSSGGASLCTALTTPQPLRRVIDIRVNQKKKDIVINANSVYRNRVNNCIQTLTPEGDIVINPPDPFNPGNILNEIAALDDYAKKHYWQTNIVQIEVDLRNIPTVVVDEKKGDASIEKKGIAKVVALETKVNDKSKGKEVVTHTPTVMDQITRLGPDFYDYATDIHIDIQFPAPRDGFLAPRAHTTANKQGRWIYPDHNISVGTPGFVILEKLAVELDKVVSIKSLEVILHNAHASATVPFTLEQLYYALPFYDLQFMDWQLKWQGNYMSEPVEVGHFPLILLDKERNKWLWGKKKAAQEKERLERLAQNKIDEKVFITYSTIGPNAPLPLFKPVPKPAPKPVANPGTKPTERHTVLLPLPPFKHLPKPSPTITAKPNEKRRSPKQQGL